MTALDFQCVLLRYFKTVFELCKTSQLKAALVAACLWRKKYSSQQAIFSQQSLFLEHFILK